MTPTPEQQWAVTETAINHADRSAWTPVAYAILAVLAAWFTIWLVVQWHRSRTVTDLDRWATFNEEARSWRR